MKSLSHVGLFVTPWTESLTDHKTTKLRGLYYPAFSYFFLQARILEWVAISFFRGSSQPRDQIQVFCIVSRFFTI